MGIKNLSRYTSVFVVFLIVFFCVFIIICEYLFLSQKTKNPTELYLKLLKENIFENTSIVAFNYGEQNGKFKNYYITENEEGEITSQITYDLKLEDRPVKFDGTFYFENDYEKEIHYLPNGFTIPGVYETIICTDNFTWSFFEKRCILKPLCTDEDNRKRNIKGLNPYYFHNYFANINFNDTLENVEKTLSTRIDNTHNFVYALCTGETVPQFNYCTNNTKYNNKLTITPDDPDYSNPCKLYDICIVKEDNFVHVEKIDSKELTASEYYQCSGGKSILKECPKFYEFDINYMTCIYKFVDFCADKEDGYNEQINEKSYFNCFGGVKYIINCPEEVLINPITGDCECFNLDCKHATNLVAVESDNLESAYYSSMTICNADCTGKNNVRDVTITQEIEFTPISLLPPDINTSDLVMTNVTTPYVKLPPKTITPSYINLPINGLVIKSCANGNVYGKNEPITRYNENINVSTNIQGLYFNPFKMIYTGDEYMVGEGEESTFYVNYLDIRTQKFEYTNPKFDTLSRIVDEKDISYTLKDKSKVKSPIMLNFISNGKEYKTDLIFAVTLNAVPRYQYVEFKDSIYEYETYNVIGEKITLVLTEELLSTRKDLTKLSAYIFALYDRNFNPLPLNYFVPLFMLNLDILGLDLSEHLSIKEDDTLFGFDVFKCEGLIKPLDIPPPEGDKN